MGKKGYWVRAGQEDFEEDPEKVLENITKSTENLINKYVETNHFKDLSDVQKDEAEFIIESFSEMMYSYHDLKLHEWDAQTAEECCKYTLVRKISGEYTFYESLVPVLASYFRFLQDQNVINNAEMMSKRLIKIEPSILKKSKDPSNWGLAKGFVMSAKMDGVDILDEEQMNQYIMRKNQGVFQKRDHQIEKPSTKMKGRERNLPCPCGSGIKYKKCCGTL